MLFILNKVLTGEKTTLLKVLLQVVSYYGSKFCQQRESYQWKFTLTVVENLTKIAKIIPGQNYVLDSYFILRREREMLLLRVSRGEAIFR